MKIQGIRATFYLVVPVRFKPDYQSQKYKVDDILGDDTAILTLKAEVVLESPPQFEFIYSIGPVNVVPYEVRCDPKYVFSPEYSKPDEGCSEHFNVYVDLYNSYLFDERFRFKSDEQVDELLSEIMDGGFFKNLKVEIGRFSYLSERRSANKR